MREWEYFTEMLRADATEADARSFLEGRWPERKFPKFAIEAIIPQLNRRGGDGWELVSLEPVIVGDKGDVKLPVGDPGQHWTNSYLAVWRRNLSES